MKFFWQLTALIRDTVAIWSGANAARMAAALAYYTMLSLAPLLVIAVGVASQFFGSEQAVTELITQIESLTSPEIAATARMVVLNTLEIRTGIFAGLISVAVLLFGASGVFSQLFDTLNVIWGVKEETRQGLRYTLKQRALGFAMVLFFGLLLVASIVMEAVGAVLTNMFRGSFPVLVRWLEALTTSSSFLVLPLIFTVLFRYLPQRDIDWGDVWPGGVLTAGLFLLGRVGIGLYLSRSSVSSVYGAAGSLVVLLIWVYFSGMILFLGAAFCKAYAQNFGSLAAGESA